MSDIIESVKSQTHEKDQIWTTSCFATVNKQSSGTADFIFAGGKVIREPDVSITTSPLSDAISADLKKRGMTFVGSTTIYAYLQVIGVINVHQRDCFKYIE